MKRLLSLILCLSILILSLQSYAASGKQSTFRQVASGTVTQANMKLSGVDAAPELVTYPTCEATTGWASSGTLTTFESSSTQKHSGTNSLRVVSDSGWKGFINTTGNYLTLVAGRQYELSWWGYLVSGVSGALYLTGIDGDGTTTCFTTGAVSHTVGAWSYHSIVFVANVSGSSGKVWFRSNNEAAEFYIDDISVKSLSNPASGGAFVDFGSQELVTGGDCEATTGWTAYNTPETFEASATQKHAGTNSLHIVDSTASYGGFKQTITQVAGKKYKLVFWYYIVSGSVYSLVSGGLGSGYSYGPISSSTVGAWTKVETTFTPSVGGSSGFIGFQNFSNSVAAEFYIDDVSITPYPNLYQNAIGNLLEIYDSSNRKISGWMKSVGTGAEGLTAELLTDPGFAAVTKASAKGVTGITKANPGVVTFGAGHGYANGDVIYFSGLTQMTELNTKYYQLRSNSGDTFQLATVYDTTSLSTAGYGAAETTGGNCAQKCTYTNWTTEANWYVGVDGAGALTNIPNGISVVNTALVQATTDTVVLKLMKVGFDLVSSSGTRGVRVLYAGGYQVIAEQTVPATYTGYRNKTGSNPEFRISAIASQFTGTVDNASLKQVLTPSTTGVTITSLKGGTLYNWAFKDAAFNWNDTGGYTYKIYKSTTNPVVASGGPITQANFHADLTATNAFVQLVGVDLTPYQDGRYMIGIYNVTGGYGMLGYISSTAPAGEQLDTEINGDPGFASDAYWNAGEGVGWTVGVTGKANATGVLAGVPLYRYNISFTAFQLIKCTFDVDSISGNIDPSLNGSPAGPAATTTGTKTYYATISTTGVKTIGFYPLNTVTAVLDNLSYKRVLDPPSTGAKIVNADKATRAWIYTHGSFDPNPVNGVTYQIFFVGD